MIEKVIPALSEDGRRPRSIEESLGETLRRLEGAQKPAAQGSPAYSRFVNRRLGRYLAALVYQAGLTPNQVTAVSTVFTGVGIALVASVHPTTWLVVLIVFCLVAGYAFDSADGQVARLRGGGSPAGEWLDHVVDSFKASAVHVVVLVGWYRFTDLDRSLLLLPIGFAVVSSAQFFAEILTDQLRRAHSQQTPLLAAKSLKGVARSVLLLPVDYGFLCLGFVLWAMPTVFAVFYGLLLLLTVAFLAAALPKWYREMTRFSPDLRRG